MGPVQAPPVGVLVVDDQQPFRAVARRLVGMVDGWQVVGEAASGEDAVAQAAATHPSVVLMDINMPGISGIEATRRILERQPGVTVVLVSTYAPEDLPADASTCGAVAYVRKDELSAARLRALPVPAQPG